MQISNSAIEQRPQSKAQKKDQTTSSNHQPPPLTGAGVLNPQMMKALKLFAKNQMELEKASDPEKGNNRRVLSYDGRKYPPATSNIPASTFEKCGGQVPSGPKFINDLVEKELSNYKVEVEGKFKVSAMNSTYVFPRKSKALHKERPSQQEDNVDEQFEQRTAGTLNQWVAGINSLNQTRPFPDHHRDSIFKYPLSL